MAEGTKVDGTDLMNLKKRVDDHKDSFIRAEGQREEVSKSIKVYGDQLKDLGVDPTKAEEHIEKAEEDLSKRYDTLKGKIDEIDEALSGN